MSVVKSGNNTEDLDFIISLKRIWDFPGAALVKNLPANAGNMGSIPGPGRSQVPRSN